MKTEKTFNYKDLVRGVYDEENRKNISKMKEVCDCYCDRMDAAIENICLTI
jgi:hypothetical protein